MENLSKQNEKLYADMERFGIYQNGRFTISEGAVQALKNGQMTDIIELSNIKQGDETFDKIPVRASIVRDEKDQLRLRIDPVYEKTQDHPLLEKSEKSALVNEKTTNIKKPITAYGKILDYGHAKYMFDNNNNDSFFVKLEKFDGQEKVLWGIDLERALEESGLSKGDNAQILYEGYKDVLVKVPQKDDKGQVIGHETKLVNRNSWSISGKEKQQKEKTTVFEYDKKTKQFLSYDPEKVRVPDEINGERLTVEMKRALKQGEPVELSDGTILQLKTGSSKGYTSNRGALILSFLIDGGISYLLLRGIENLTGSLKAQSNTYSKGYMDALAQLSKSKNQQGKNSPINKEPSTEKDEQKTLTEDISKNQKEKDSPISKESSTEKKDTPLYRANFRM